MRVLLCILFLFLHEFIKFNKTGARMLDSESMYMEKKPNIHCSINHTHAGSKMAVYVQRTL